MHVWSGNRALVSVIIVTYESGNLLLECLESLRRQGMPMQVIVVNNGSGDPSLAVAAARFPGLELVQPPRNLGFAGGVNAGAHHAQSDHLLILNPDVRLDSGCVAELIRELQRPGVAVVGP